MRLLALAIGVVLAAALPAAADESSGPSPSQKQALYAKPSVVRVVAIYEVVYGFNGKEAKQYIGGTGSGFFVSSDGYIATNAHVVQDIQEGEAAARRKTLTEIVQDLEKQRFTRDQIETVLSRLTFIRAKATAEVVLPDGTKLPYTIKAYGAPVGEGDGRDVAIIKVETQNAPNLIIGDSEKMQVQDKVLAIGYPGAADLAGLLDSKSQLEASITDGAVSAKKRTTEGDPVLQVSVPITHGNSGGPAINDKGEVIGLTTFGSKNEVQGFNFLVASSTVLKFVKQAKADNSPSNTHKLWRKALDEYWDFDFDQAIVDFEEVMTLFPSHSEAPRLVKDARAGKKEGKSKKKEASADSGGGGGGTAAGIIIALLIGGALIGGVIVVINKGKKSVQPTGPYGQVPMQPPGMVPPPGMPPQPGMPQPGMPYGAPMPPQQGTGPMMIGGRVQQPVAKTVAIGQATPSVPIAATAFGSLAVGSLTCTRGLLNGQRFSLTPQGILIGRQPGLAQIVINDSRASGKHVWIGYENGVLVAVDQGTTNGTFVNDVRYGRISKAPLKDGDIVIVSEPDCLSLQLKLS
jgi:S1-C subfamily serine protease